MKKFLFVCAIAVSGLFTSVASAQDYCCPTQYDECCNETGSFDGFYIGANLGAFTDTYHRNDYDGFFGVGAVANWTTIGTDVTVGVQLGYDWLCNSSLFGLVADWSWVNTNVNQPIEPNYDPGLTDSLKTRTNWYTTIRARAGITLCDALLYITGGAAVTKFDTKWIDSSITFKDNNTKWGWVGGFGAEYLVWCNWSFGAEFLFMQFSHSQSSHTHAGVPYAFGRSDSVWVGRFVLNYRFGDLCGCFW